jgi:hypothetical protein
LVNHSGRDEIVAVIAEVLDVLRQVRLEAPIIPRMLQGAART